MSTQNHKGVGGKETKKGSGGRREGQDQERGARQQAGSTNTGMKQSLLSLAQLSTPEILYII
jgi:hypothetical protein